MSETLRRIVQTRAGGAVERCHSIRHIGSYSNAAHQWGVAMLMRAIWPQDFPRLVAHCLTHDVPEAWVGDIPATTKRYAGIRDQVSDLEDDICIDLDLPRDCTLWSEDEKKIKCCDQLELWFWSMEQYSLGNAFANEIMIELERFWRETPMLPEAMLVWSEAKSSGVLPRISGVIKELTTKEKVA